MYKRLIIPALVVTLGVSACQKKAEERSPIPGESDISTYVDDDVPADSGIGQIPDSSGAECPEAFGGAIKVRIMVAEGSDTGYATMFDPVDAAAERDANTGEYLAQILQRETNKRITWTYDSDRRTLQYGGISGKEAARVFHGIECLAEGYRDHLLDYEEIFNAYIE